MRSGYEFATEGGKIAVYLGESTTTHGNIQVTRTKVFFTLRRFKEGVETFYLSLDMPEAFSLGKRIHKIIREGGSTRILRKNKMLVLERWQRNNKDGYSIALLQKDGNEWKRVFNISLPLEEFYYLGELLVFLANPSNAKYEEKRVEVEKEGEESGSMEETNPFELEDREGEDFPF